MADLTAVRQAIADQLSARIPNVRTSATVPDGNIDVTTKPLLFVGLPTTLHTDIVTYDYTLGNGTADWQLVVTLIVSPWDQGRGQAKLDPFLGNTPGNAQSVYLAIKADHTLGGVVSSVRVTRARRYGPHKIGDTPYLGVDFDISILTSP